MPDDHPLELVAAYALDAVDADERARVEAHLASCAICTEELRAQREIAGALAEDAAASPPAGLRSSILDEIARTPQERVDTPQHGSFDDTTAHETGADDTTADDTVISMPQPSRRRLPVAPLLAAAAAIVVAGLLLFGAGADDDLRREVVDAPDAVTVELARTEDAARGMLEVVWSAERDAIVVTGSDLEDPGPGRAYALWFLVDDGVVPAGLFATDDGMVDTSFAVDDRATNGWGITLEPDTGSPQPTGPVLFVGTV